MHVLETPLIRVYFTKGSFGLAVSSHSFLHFSELVSFSWRLYGRTGRTVVLKWIGFSDKVQVMITLMTLPYSSRWWWCSNSLIIKKGRWHSGNITQLCSCLLLSQLVFLFFPFSSLNTVFPFISSPLPILPLLDFFVSFLPPLLEFTSPPALTPKDTDSSGGVGPGGHW